MTVERLLSSLDDSTAQYFRRLEIDENVIRRYQATPQGFRKHPSYYSERYLPRSNTPGTALAGEWGYWKLVDPLADSRPNNDFYDQFPNRDVPWDKFPTTAWQKDTDYLAKFLPEGIALVDRALEAILSEYGRGKKDMPGISFEERSSVFRVSIQNSTEGAVNGWIPPASFEGLKRRILHAVVAQDRFTFAMGGHSAAAGHGNYFQQSYTLQVGRILEPIFARLGVKASARNFGFGGLGTLQSALAIRDMYGNDVDALLWDSGMTENDDNRRGIFFIQALMGMERAPVLFGPGTEVLKFLSSFADVAAIGGSNLDRSEVATLDQFSKVPYALQFNRCPKDLKNLPSCARYESVCWADRSNFIWEGMNLSYVPKYGQGNIPGRAGWHPGNREHQFAGRLYTFPILQALRDVLAMWNEAPQYVLQDDQWHVTEHYKRIKGNVIEYREKYIPWCDSRKLPKKFCMHAASGRTEFTPRYSPWSMSLRRIMAGSEKPTENEGASEYDPPNVPVPHMDPPEGAINVLAIIENGIKFPKNLARIQDSAQDMRGPVWTEYGKGSKYNPEIKGGKGWDMPDSDSCDGEYDSWCKKAGGCLLYAHNDDRAGIHFDGYSGWLIFNVPKVEHGVVVAKFHTWLYGDLNPKTKDWCSENNVEPCKARALEEQALDEQRQLANVPPFCDEFVFEFAINGKITSWKKDEFVPRINPADRVIELVVLMDEENFEGPKDLEVAMRMKGCGRSKHFSLTHLYWI